MITPSMSGKASRALVLAGQVFGGAALVPILRDAGAAAGVAAESVISPYPDPSGKPLERYYTRVRADGTTYKSKFKSMRQQAKVMQLAEQGAIPYRRTGTLGKSITSEARDVSESGVTTAVGTNIPYAPFVIGNSPDEQSHYHAGNWTPLVEDINRDIGTVVQAFENALVRGIEGALKGN